MNGRVSLIKWKVSVYNNLALKHFPVLAHYYELIIDAVVFVSQNINEQKSKLDQLS